MTLLIAALCVAVGMLRGGRRRLLGDAVALRPEALTGRPARVLAYLASINLLLLVFNLIPAFPLDGGRIARAIAWKMTGDRTRATALRRPPRTAFSYVLIGLGIFSLVSAAT